MKVKVWFYLALLFSSSLASFSDFSLSKVSTSADALSMSNPREMTWEKLSQHEFFSQAELYASYLHGKDHYSTADLMPSKGIGHPDFCDKVEENNNDDGGGSSGLVSEGEGYVGKCVECEKVEDPVAKEVGGKHCARHHTRGMAQPWNDLFGRF